MSWNVRWSDESTEDVRRMAPTVAERVCREVYVLAAESDADLAELPRQYCVSAPGAMAVVYINEAARTLEVHRIHRTRR
jgi:hypothetical protein